MTSSVPLKKHLRRILWSSLLIVVVLCASKMAAYSADDAFALPKPGDYKLGHITKFPNGWVLDRSPWWPKRLSSYSSGKITLFTFFYSTCRDVDGCPAVWSTFYSIHDDLKRNPEFHDKVRLVFLSLDPALDTPEALRVFAHAHAETNDVAPWYFLTTWSEWFLAPIINKLEQSASRDLNDNGTPSLTISHQVKFYLVDKDMWVREIYTSNYIEPDVVLNDMRTLLIEAKKKFK